MLRRLVAKWVKKTEAIHFLETKVPAIIAKAKRRLRIFVVKPWKFPQLAWSQGRKKTMYYPRRVAVVRYLETLLSWMDQKRMVVAYPRPIEGAPPGTPPRFYCRKNTDICRVTGLGLRCLYRAAAEVEGDPMNRIAGEAAYHRRRIEERKGPPNYFSGKGLEPHTTKLAEANRKLKKRRFGLDWVRTYPRSRPIDGQTYYGFAAVRYVTPVFIQALGLGLEFEEAQRMARAVEIQQQQKEATQQRKANEASQPPIAKAGREEPTERPGSPAMPTRQLLDSS